MTPFSGQKISPPPTQVLWQNARALQNAGQFVEAAQAFQTFLGFEPQHWAALYNLGLVYQELRLNEQARDVYQLAVKFNPGLAQAHNNLGSVLWSLDDAKGALTSYTAAVALNPQLAIAHYNKGLVEESLGYLTPLIASMQRAVELEPSNDIAWEKIFSTQMGLKQREEAFGTFYRWEKTTAVSLKRVPAGLIVSRLTGNKAKEQEYLDAIQAWPFKSYSPIDLIPILGNLQYFDVPAQTILECYQRFNRAMKAQHKDQITLLPKRSPGKLRIGYVSPDFRKHVMGRIMLEVIRNHDRDKFEIFLISTCDARFHDSTTSEFRALSAGFADISKLKDRQAAQIIAEVDLDILVDLAGHTLGGRPGVYAHKPARHIVTHLGYHGCIGLEDVEYKLTDSLADTQESVQYQIERPLYLETCLFPFSRVAPAIAETSRDELRQSLGFSDHFVFATFVNPIKLAPRCLATWKRVLEAVPNGKLAFSPYEDGDKRMIVEIAAAAGIDQSYITFIPNEGDDAKQRARYRAVDAVLDTFPYAGGDTTLAALDMLIPVVTLKGERNSERTGYSILGHLGLFELIAETDDEFVGIAKRLACDSEWKESLRLKLIESLETRPSAKLVNHVKALEIAYRQITANNAADAAQLSARAFHEKYQATLRRHQSATDDEARVLLDDEYAKLLAEQPGYSPVLYARAMLAIDRRESKFAGQLLSELLVKDPVDHKARIALASVLLELERNSEALDAIQPVILDAARDSKAYLIAARANLALEKWEQVEESARLAVGLAPTSPEAVFIYGVALSHMSRPEEALAMFNRVLALSPQHFEAAFNAAVLMEEHGQFETAVQLFLRSLAISPESEVAHWRLTGLLERSGSIDEFSAATRRFEKVCSFSLKSRLRIAQLSFKQGNSHLAASSIQGVAAEILSQEDPTSLEEAVRMCLDFAVNLDCPPALLSQLAEFSNKSTLLLFGQSALAGSRPEHSERIRIGYLLGQYPDQFGLSQLIKLISMHDQQKFEIIVFSFSPLSPTLITQAGAGLRVLNMTGWTARKAIAAIAENGCDILVDATDLREEKVSQIFCEARVGMKLQIPLMSGYSWRAGGSRLSNSYLEQAKVDDLFAAEAIPMRCPLAPFSFLEKSAHVLSESSTRGVPDHKIVFAVASPSRLMSERCLSVWKSVLDKSDGTHILLIVSNANEEQIIINLFKTASIRQSRYTIFNANADVNLARAGQFDAVLDTLPTNCTQSASLAISSKTPLVTLSGKLPGERQVGAILNWLNLRETIAESGTHYAEICERMEKDKDWRRFLIEKMTVASEYFQRSYANEFISEYEAKLRARLTPDGQAQLLP